jgi:hypothetical protein
MKPRILALPLVLFTTGTGCASNFTPSATSPSSYNGTASVGDSLTITLDPAAHTLKYTNLCNQDAGTIPYTVNSDGTYTLNDPTGNLIAAYEVPNGLLPRDFSRTSSSRSWSARFCFPLSAPRCLGDRGIPAIIYLDGVGLK